MRNCDSCNIELTPVFSDRLRRIHDYPQYENALVIELSGGYGMLIDPIGGEIPKFVICKDCGIKFIKQNELLITPETEFLVREEAEDATG